MEDIITIRARTYLTDRWISLSPASSFLFFFFVCFFSGELVNPTQPCHGGGDVWLRLGAIFPSSG